MALKEILARFTFLVDSSPLKKGADGMASFARTVVGTFAGAAVVGAIQNFVTNTLAMGDAIVDTSAALGVSTDALQAWQYAGGQVGISNEKMAGAFKFLQKNAVEGIAAFKEIGVTVKDAAGNIAPAEDLMRGVAQGLSEIEDPAKRTALALEIFGKSGSELNALFANGADGIDEMMARFKELGGGFSAEALLSMDAAGDAIADVEVASNSLKGSLMLTLAPAIRELANGVAKFAMVLNKGGAESNRLKSALIVLGVVGAAAGLAMLAPFLPFVAAVTVAFLLVQDFYAFMQGGDSATGRLLDKLFGKGAAADVRGKIKAIVKDIEDLWKKAKTDPGGAAFAFITEALSRLGADLTKFVVEDIPAAFDLADKNVQAGVGTWGEHIAAALNPLRVIRLAFELGSKIVNAIAEGITAAGSAIATAITNALPTIDPTALLGGGGGGGDAPAAPAAEAPKGTWGGRLINNLLPGGGGGIHRRLSANIGGPGAGTEGTFKSLQQQNTNTINIYSPDGRSAAPLLERSLGKTLGDERGAAMEALTVG